MYSSATSTYSTPGHTVQQSPNAIVKSQEDVGNLKQATGAAMGGHSWGGCAIQAGIQLHDGPKGGDSKGGDAQTGYINGNQSTGTHTSMCDNPRYCGPTCLFVIDTLTTKVFTARKERYRM
jgi:hypothetical protein